ncbi:MAG: T9SS type A sorting domain-containing protein, partial [Bacteroidota bacterium]
NPVATFTETHTICQGETYAWHGQNLTVAGPYTAQELNVNNCFDTYNLTLKVNPVFTFNEAQTICQGETYVWHGQNLTIEGPYTAQEINTYGCLDTYNLTLTVNPVNTFNETHAICQGYTYEWHGQSLTVEGSYTAHETNTYGCIDTYNLTLTVNPVYTYNETHTICQGETYEWWGQSLTSSGLYYYVLNNGNCYDSYYLTLTVNPVNTYNETHTICQGETYVWHGQNLTIEGLYTAQETNTYGCLDTYNLTLTVNPNPAPPTSGGDVTVCANSLPATLVDIVPQGMQVKWYDAPIGGNFLANGANYITSTAGIYYNETVNPTTGCISTSRTAVVLTINPMVTSAVSIVADNQTVCSGTAVHFTATPTNGGTAPIYDWYVGGVLQTGHLSTLTYTGASTSIYCKLTSNINCLTANPVTSNTIIITVNPNLTPSVSIVADNQTVCLGTLVTLTANPVNGGSTPIYDWYVGGVLQAGHSGSLQITPNANISVYCKMTSNVTCPSTNLVTSNTVNITINPILTPSVSIVADNLTVCTGTAIHFTVTPTNGGAHPTFNWYRDGALMYGTTQDTITLWAYVSSSVYCKMTSSASCISANSVQSNTITYTAIPVVTPTVTIAASANPVNTGTSVTYTPTIQSGYTVSSTAWYVNTVLASTASTYSYNPANGDQVYVKILFNEGCTAQSTSNTITMSVSTVTSLPVVSTWGITNNIYTGVTLNGSVTNNGGDLNVQRGFIYSTNPTPTELNGTKVNSGTVGAGDFSKVIAGLTPNTYYYVKAYATNTMGTSYGSVVAFDTRNINVFTGVGNWSNTARWSKGSIPTPTSSVFIQGTCTVDVNGDCYSIGVYPTSSITIPVGFTINTNLYALVYSDATGTGAIVQMGTLNVSTANGSQFQRYVTLAPLYHFVSSPLSLATSWQFTNGTGGATLASFNEATDLFTNVVVNSYLGIGKGYKLSSPTKTTFTMSGGVFNKGDKTLALSYTAGHGTNLVGNPYPCRLDLHGSNAWTKNNVSNTITTWNPTIGNYDTWNGVIGTNMLSSGFLAETQGFQVLATGAAPSITIPEIAQSAQYSNNFKNVVPNLVRLNISGNNSSDEMVVYFDQNATSGLDHQFDAEKEYGNIDAPQLFSITSNDVLSINCLPEVNSTVTVPVGLKVGVNTNYTITARDIESFDAGTNVYLEDLKLNKMINLNEKATYSFDANTNDVVNRFMLHFGNPTSTNSAITLNSYSYDNTLYVNNPSLVNINEVVVYNALGQIVTSFKPEITSLKGYSINASTGSYIVKIVTDNNVVSNKVNLK